MKGKCRVLNWGFVKISVISIFSGGVFSSSAVRADDANPLEVLMKKCATRVYSKLSQGNARLGIFGKNPVGPVYHDSQVQVGPRAGSGEMYVTGPQGTSFGVIPVGEMKAGFGAPQFQIHTVHGLEGELKAIKFDGLGHHAVGVLEAALIPGNPESKKALFLVPLRVSNENTGELEPMGDSFGMPLNSKTQSKIKIWEQVGTSRFYMTSESNSYSVFEIGETGSLELIGAYRVVSKSSTKAPNKLKGLKIHEIHFLGDFESALVRFQVGENGEHAIAMARKISDESGELEIDFDTASRLRDGKIAPLSIAIQPYSGHAYVNYADSYDIFAPNGHHSTFDFLANFSHPVEETKSIHCFFEHVKTANAVSIYFV
jgi:hypothetical protein